MVELRFPTHSGTRISDDNVDGFDHEDGHRTSDILALANAYRQANVCEILDGKKETMLTMIVVEAIFDGVLSDLHSFLVGGSKGCRK